MTMNHRLLLTTLLAVTGLAACGGDGSSEAGIRVTSNTTYMNSETASGEPDYATDPQGEASSIKAMYRSDNMYIDLQLGLVNLRAAGLSPCGTTVASAARRLLDFVLPSAHAHSAHIPSGPAGVVDVLKPDLLVWNLGSQAANAGSYCGVTIEILPVAGHTDAHGDDETGSNMAGAGILVSPCYYPDTAGSDRTPLDSSFPHSCIEAAYRGAAVQRRITFDEPLNLNSANRAANLLLATAYNTWFDGLDMAILETSEAEQARLAQNVLDSFYVMAAD